ncbi:hypothetical protein C8Q80DRAFT_1187044, partial [Daedaleopsis nitida]
PHVRPARAVLSRTRTPTQPAPPISSSLDAPNFPQPPGWRALTLSNISDYSRLHIKRESRKNPDPS